MIIPTITWENGSRQPVFLIVMGILLAISILVVCGRCVTFTPAFRHHL